MYICTLNTIYYLFIYLKLVFKYIYLYILNCTIYYISIVLKILLFIAIMRVTPVPRSHQPSIAKNYYNNYYYNKYHK